MTRTSAPASRADLTQSLEGLAHVIQTWKDGKPGKPGTHDNDIVNFVKLGFTGSVCCGDGRNSCRQGSSLNQTAAGEFCHG